MYARSFDVHDRFCQQDFVRFGTAVWMRILAIVRLPLKPYNWLLVSSRVEHWSAKWCNAALWLCALNLLVVPLFFCSMQATVVGGLQVGMLVAQY